MSDSTVLNTHVFVTMFMVGLIWFIQIVHYPMLADVGESDFIRFEQIHQQRTTWVVLPIMLVELAAAVWLVFQRPPALSPVLTWVGLLLLLGVWAATFLISVPCHTQLSTGFDAEAHQRLVTTNWLRTVGWTTRGVIAIWMVRQVANVG